MVSPNISNEIIPIRGINHTATMSKSFQGTVDFYSNKLGMKLVCNMCFPGGNHFFIDVGNGGDVLAFVSFNGSEPEGFPVKMGLPPDAPGVARSDLFDGGAGKSAIGSLNRMVLDVPAGKLVDYRSRLEEGGVVCTPIETDAFGRRIFLFQDVDGMVLGMAADSGQLSGGVDGVAPGAAVEPNRGSDAVHR